MHNPQIDSACGFSFQNPGQHLERILCQPKSSGQIITGAGGHISQLHMIKILYTVNGFIDGAVSPKDHQLYILSFTGQIPAYLFNMSLILGKIDLIRNPCLPKAVLRIFPKSKGASRATGRINDDMKHDMDSFLLCIAASILSYNRYT